MSSRIITIIFFSFAFCVAILGQKNIASTDQELRNQAVYNKIAIALQDDTRLPLPQLTVQVALQLSGTPYVGGLLEIEPEQLHVFLDKTDCILFVELCASMALTLKGKRIVQGKELTDAAPSYDLLLDNISNMRYRLGVVNGYSSRLHYTSEWLLQNHTNGVLQEYTAMFGTQYRQVFSFMSTHPAYYRQLSDTTELNKIRQIEKRLSTLSYYHLTQSVWQTPKVISQIQNGDIIAFVSRQEGLDISHIAIAYEHKGEMHFIHASSKAGEVIIEPKTLIAYTTAPIRLFRLEDI